MIENIYSESSFAGCIKKGFNYVIRNPWLVTRVMGPWALVSSLGTVLYHSQPSLLTFPLFLITSYLFIVRLMIFFRRNQNRVEMQEASRRLNEGEDIEVQKVTVLTMKDRLRELLHYSLLALPYLIWGYIITFVSSLGIVGLATVYLAQQSTTTKCFALGIMVVLLCLAVVFCLPLIHTFYHTMMKNGKGKFRDDYKAAFKLKGKTFGVVVMTSILTGLLCIIPAMPAVVSLLAYTTSQHDIMAYDDPVVITTSGNALMLITSVLSVTVCHLLGITYYASLLYLTAKKKPHPCPPQ